MRIKVGIDIILKNIKNGVLETYLGPSENPEFSFPPKCCISPVAYPEAFRHLNTGLGAETRCPN